MFNRLFRRVAPWLVATTCASTLTVTADGCFETWVDKMPQQVTTPTQVPVQVQVIYPQQGSGTYTWSWAGY